MKINIDRFNGEMKWCGQTLKVYFKEIGCGESISGNVPSLIIQGTNSFDLNPEFAKDLFERIAKILENDGRQ